MVGTFAEDPCIMEEKVSYTAPILPLSTNFPRSPPVALRLPAAQRPSGRQLRQRRARSLGPAHLVPGAPRGNVRPSRYFRTDIESYLDFSANLCSNGSPST